MLNFRLDNKLALVTGCSKGIGMAIAIALAESGNADYFCTCDDKLLRNAKKVKDLAVKVLNPVDLVQEIEK